MSRNKFQLMKLGAFFLLLIYLGAGNSYARINKDLFRDLGGQKYIDLNLEKQDVDVFHKTARETKRRNWKRAISLAGSMKNENFRDAMIDYVLWQKFTKIKAPEGASEFANLTGFIRKNDYLPNAWDLRRKAGQIYLKNDIPYIYAEKFFTMFPPLDTEVAMKVLQDKLSLIDNNIITEIKKQNIRNSIGDDIRKVWINKNFTHEQEIRFLEMFGDRIPLKTHKKRIERLIWDAKHYDAERLLQSLKDLDLNHKVMYLAIMHINENPKYINHILRTVPRVMRDNELLLYSRIRYYHKRKKKKKVFKILYQIANKEVNHKKWWRYRKIYTREYLKSRDYKKAYYLISKHQFKKGADFAEAEWLSGWIALRFLKKPKLAYKHFYTMHEGVSYPISLSRAAYWAGRALQEEGKRKEALYWYHVASKYPTYFYGQLGIHAKYDILTHTSVLEENPLPEKPEISIYDKQKVTQNRIVNLAYLLAVLGKEMSVSKDLFRQAIKKAGSKSEVAMILNIVKSIDDIHLTTSMTKHAITKDVFFIEDLYPVLNIVDKDDPNAHLIHAIIRQESGFHTRAKSSAGAIGFMQLMPETAKAVSRKLGVRYNKKRLMTDPKYNILLGSSYIGSLMKQFKGSEMLAIASYNAGPAAVKRWMKLFGDPRRRKDIKDIIDWIELITYAETRHYVHRVIENSIVYEYVLEDVRRK